jgi:hypothetical protein
MPDFFVSLERAISQMAYAKDVSAPILSATEHPTELAGRIGTDQEGQSQSERGYAARPRRAPLMMSPR